MPTKDIDISTEIVQAIRRVLLRGESAQVKFNERDRVVKVFGVKVRIEKEEPA